MSFLLITLAHADFYRTQNKTKQSLIVTELKYVIFADNFGACRFCRTQNNTKQSLIVTELKCVIFADNFGNM